MGNRLEAAFQLFTELLQRHWVSALFLLLTVTTLCVTAALRWWFRRRWQRLLEESFEEQHELDLLPPLGPKDQEAQRVVKELRRQVWDIPENQLQLGMDALTSRATAVIHAVAAVYHPSCEVPEYEATLAQSLHLIERVSRKVAHFATVTPWQVLSNRKLSDYQRYYQIYRKINDSSILQLLKRHRHLYRVARWAMNLKNIGNPLYWAGKELSREGYFLMLRWFHLGLISQVGREAMKLYSGRQFQREEERDATLVCYKLFALTQKWGGPTTTEWPILIEYVSNHSCLELEVRLHILNRWSQKRLPKALDALAFQTQSARSWYEQGLKALLKKDARATPVKKLLIEQELESLAAATEEPPATSEPAEPPETPL